MSKLALACEMSLNGWLATFPDVIPKAEYTKRHEKWKKNLFNKMRDDHYHRFTTKTVKVLLVAAVLLALLLTAFVIPSSREFILDKFDTHSTYKLTEDNNNSVTNEMVVGYLPDGFELQEQNRFDKQIVNVYSSKDGKFFTIQKSSSSMKVEFNTEGFITEEVEIDNIMYVYCQGEKGVNNIVWSKNDYVYRIDGNLTKEEFIKIAKTVE